MIFGTFNSLNLEKKNVTKIHVIKLISTNHKQIKHVIITNTISKSHHFCCKIKHKYALC